MNINSHVCSWCGYTWPRFVGPKCPRCGLALAHFMRQRDRLRSALESLVISIKPQPSNAVALNHAHQTLKEIDGEMSSQPSPEQVESALTVIMNLPLEPSLAGHVAHVVADIRKHMEKVHGAQTGP